MRYGLTLEDGSRVTYDTGSNSFTLADGSPVILNVEKKPEKKKVHVRISLGMACNMSCSYCSERQNRTKFIEQAINAKEYVAALVSYIDTHFDHPELIVVSFWGGEPLLYAEIMRGIHREMSAITEGRELQYGLSTNGKLLKGPVFRWLVDNRIQFSVSYDGPGQSFRDPDNVLKPGSVQLANLRRYLADGLPGLAFNPVIHKGNPSFDAYETYMRELLQWEEVPIGDAPYLRIHDDPSAHYALTEEQLREDMAGRLERINTGRRLPNSFYVRLLRTLRAKTVPFPCITMDKEGYLAVDLQGNIWGCHNNVGQYREENGGNLYGGNIHSGERVDIPYVALTRRRASRCPDCLLLYVCGGSCGLTPVRYEEQNCAIAWHHNFPVFYQMVKIATLGGKLSAVQKTQEE